MHQNYDVPWNTIINRESWNWYSRPYILTSPFPHSHVYIPTCVLITWFWIDPIFFLLPTWDFAGRTCGQDWGGLEAVGGCSLVGLASLHLLPIPICCFGQPKINQSRCCLIQDSATSISTNTPTSNIVSSHDICLENTVVVHQMQFPKYAFVKRSLQVPICSLFSYLCPYYAYIKTFTHR